MKNPKHRLLGTYSEIVMSHVHRTQSVSAVFCPFFHHSSSVNTIESYEYQKSECVQQWNLFKCQTSTFFQHIVQIYLNTYWHTPVRPYERRDCCDRWISRWNNTSARSFFTNNTFSSTSKLFTPNMYCWSCKTLVTIYLMYLRMNGIWEKSFCTHKCITEHCSFQR